MAKKQDKTGEKLLISTGASVVVTIALCVWLRYDFYQQKCALEGSLCLAAYNKILFILTKIALTVTLVLVLALLEHKYEVSKGGRISVAKKTIGYSVFAIIIYLAIGWLMMFK